MDSLGRYFEKVQNELNNASSPNTLLLDIGCGDGFHSSSIANKINQAIAIDIIPSNKWGGLSGEVNFLAADTFHLPFKSNTFDLIFIKDVLHHLKNPSLGIVEALRVTRSGGQLIIIESNRLNPISYFHMVLMMGHEHLTKREILKILSSFPIEIEYRSFETHVYPFKNSILLRSIYAFENLIDRLSFFEALRSYNVFTVRKLNSGEPIG